MTDKEFELQKELDNKEKFLLIKEGPYFKVQVLEERMYSLGRSSSADINLKSTGISRHHASIYFDQEGFWILDGDLEGNWSTNGLMINDERKYLHRLYSGDIILFCQDIYALFINRQDIQKTNPSTVLIFNELMDFLVGKVEANFNLKKKQLSMEEPETRRSNPSSNYDDLTKLPNRSVFLERINHLILLKNQVKEDHKFAVLFIDFDKFKLISDSLGHFVGDQFLVKRCVKRQYLFSSSMRISDVQLKMESFNCIINLVVALKEKRLAGFEALSRLLGWPITLVSRS